MAAERVVKSGEAEADNGTNEKAAEYYLINQL